MTLKRIVRDRYLTKEEAKKYSLIREQVEKELPDLIKQHQERMKEKEKFNKLPLMNEYEVSPENDL